MDELMVKESLNTNEIGELSAKKIDQLSDDLDKFLDEIKTDDFEKRIEISGYPEEIKENISNKEQLDIYENVNLVPSEINEMPCLKRTDIDLEQVDSFGQSNLERMQKGLCPILSNGEKVELHHIGGKSDSPLAELSQSEHRGKGNHGILHPGNSTIPSEISRNTFNTEKANYWKERANEYL